MAHPIAAGSVMLVTPDWAGAISAYLTAQRSTGAPATTLYTRRQHLEHLARHIGAGPWQVTGEALVEFTGAQTWQPNTRRGRRATFLSFYRWALRMGRCSTNPAEALERVRLPEPNPRPAPDDVYLAALLHADDDEALWIDLAAEHGLRRGEIAVIWPERDMVQTLLGWDLTVHGKGARTRTVPLTANMAESLLARGPGWAFPGEVDGHVSPRWIGKRIARLLPGDWTIHKLRHRAATRFDEASGGDNYAVARLMGWSNLNMVPVYVKRRDDHLRGIVQAAARQRVAVQ